MDIRRYFSFGPNDYLCREASQALNPEGPSTSSQICVGRELHSLLVQQEANARMRQQTIPKKVKKDVTYRAWKYGISDAHKWGDKKYPEYKFNRENVRDWKFKYEKYCKESRYIIGKWCTCIKMSGKNVKECWKNQSDC